MNRKSRRAAQKQPAAPAAAVPPQTPSPPAGAGPSGGGTALQRAFQLLQAGQPEAAAQVAMAVAEHAPDTRDAWVLAGMALRQQGRRDAAFEAFGRAVQLDPTCLFAVRPFAELLAEAGHTKAAAEAYETVVRLAPDDPVSWSTFGGLLRQEGRLAEAEQAYLCAIRIAGRHPALLNNLALTLVDFDRAGDALPLYLEVLQQQPNEVDVLYNLGNLYRREKRFVEAERLYERCLQANPDHIGARTNLGLCHKEAKRFDEAIRCFEEVLRRKPEHETALHNLAAVFIHLREFDEAAPYLDTLLARNPNLPDARTNRATLAMQSDRMDDALRDYLDALRIYLGRPEFDSVFETAIGPDGRPTPQFLALLEQVPVERLHAPGIGGLAGLLATTGSFEQGFALYHRFVELAGETLDSMLFFSNYHPGMTGEDVVAMYRAVGEALQQEAPRKAPAVIDKGGAPDRPIRIGYSSPDFRRHVCSLFLEGPISQHDRSLVEPVALANLIEPDETTERFQSYFTDWHRVESLTDDQMDEMIRDLGIDIVVDCAGHTAGNRLRALAGRPAPVQATWLIGYGFTTGLPWIDYFIADSVSAGPDAQHLVTEKVAAMPPYSSSYRPWANVEDIGPSPVSQNGFITFGSLTRSVRVNDRVVRVWAEILKQVPNSRLMINSRNFKSDYTRNAFIHRFEQHGIARERLDIGFTKGSWQLLNGMDIGLDCFPHNSGTTLFETLYMGVPFVTLADRPSVGRLGSAILVGAGHPEWIAWSEDEYIRKAVRLANDREQLARLRATMRQEMQASRLMDDAAVARNLEAIYRQMFDRACRGLPPASFMV